MNAFYNSIFRFLLSLFSLIPITLFAQTPQISVGGELKQWHTLQLSIPGPSTYELDSINPFLDYRLNVTFSHADTSFMVPGFYAGDGNAANTSADSGNVWQVRFSPELPGEWSYSVSFQKGPGIAIEPLSTAGTPLLADSAFGSFLVDPSDKLKPDFRARGRLNYTGNHYFQFAGDGKAYLKAGTNSPENFLGYYEFDNTTDFGGVQTPGLIDGLHRYGPHLQDWVPGDPTWQNGKGKAIIGSLNYLASKGVNSVYFLTYNTNGGDGQDTYMWVEPFTRDRYDVSKLAQWEIVFAHMDKLGIQLHVVTQETENNTSLGNLSTERKLYYRELIARFGHHLALQWNIGEENTNSDFDRKEFAKYIRETDPYNHPIAIHSIFNEASSYFDGLLGNPYFEAASIQGNGDQYDDWARELRIDSENKGRKWAIYGDEQAPEVKPNQENGKLRQIWWNSVMHGSAGCEWYFGYQGTFGDVQSEDFRVVEELWYQTRYGIDFFDQHVSIMDMQPRDDLISNGHSMLAKPGEVYAAYIQQYNNFTINLDTFTNPLPVAWYNPREGGELIPADSAFVQGPGWVSVGGPPADSSIDWVLLIGSQNIAPSFSFDHASIFKRKPGFADTIQINPLLDPFIPEEDTQQVAFRLIPGVSELVNVVFDSLSGKVEISSKAGQLGSELFTLIADDGQQVNNLFSRQFQVIVAKAKEPIAQIIATPVSGTLPLEVQFSGLGSQDVNGPIDHYLWNFGDGFVADSAEIQHTYHKAGDYQVSLTVVDEDGMIGNDTITIQVQEPTDSILMVVASIPLNAGDQAIANHLQAQGYILSFRDQNQAQASDADGMQMVLISSTVVSGTINTKFSGVEVPVISWEPYLFDDLGMTDGQAEQSFGHLSNESILIIELADSNLNGVQTVLSSPDRLAWGVPGSDAEIFARFQSDPNKIAAFGYLAGDNMPGGTAPSIRVGMFLQDNTATQFNQVGWDLFDAIICWVANCEVEIDTITDRFIAPISNQNNKTGDSIALSISLFQALDTNMALYVTGLPDSLGYIDSIQQIVGIIDSAIGVYPVSINLVQSDTTGTPDSLSFSTIDSLSFFWTVFTPNPNKAPVIAAIPDQISEQGDSVYLSIPANDPDGDSLFFYVTGLPDSLQMDSIGNISGFVHDSVGVYAIQVIVRDNGRPTPDTALMDFNWEVIPPIPNFPPVLDAIADQSNEAFETVSLVVSAQDPDLEDSISFEAFNLPPGLSMDSRSGLISGTLEDQPANYEVLLIASDNGEPIERDSITFVWNVQPKTWRALIVGGGTIQAGDAAVHSRLQILNFEVDYHNANQYDTTGFSAYDLIYVSSTVNSWTVGTSLTQFDVPIVCAEPYLLDDMGLTGPAAEVDYGNLSNQQLAYHSLSDSVILDTLSLSPQSFGWGAPNSSAKIFAYNADMPQKKLAFTYEKAAMMVGLAAPARRGGIFLRDETALALSQTGWNIFDQVVLWVSQNPYSNGEVSPIEVNPAPSSPDPLEIVIYPNPATDLVRILMEEDVVGRIFITDLEGRLHFSGQGPQLDIDVNSLTPGLYIVDVIDGARRTSKLLIKQ